METKIVLQDLVDAEQSIPKLEEAEVPVKLKYRASKWIRKMRAELKDYYDARNELLEECGEFNDETQQWLVRRDSGKYDKFLKGVQGLLEEVVQLNGVTQIPVSELPEDCGLNAGDFARLWFIITEGDENEEDNVHLANEDDADGSSEAD